MEVDSIALDIKPNLQKIFSQISFKEFDSAENLENEGRNLIILDAAIGIPKVVQIDDLGKLSSLNICSMHDFDLSITLKLLKKLNKIDSINIIAIPAHYEKSKAIEECINIISNLLSKNE